MNNGPGFIEQINNQILEWNSSVWSLFNGRIGHWLGAHLFNILMILLLTWLARKYGSRLAMRLIARTVRKDLYPTKLDRQKRIRTLQSMVNAIFQGGTWAIAILLIISELRPAYTGAIFASAGIIGVALGFGTQSLIKDLVSGIFIITENQYRVGDTVTLNNVSGKVEAITIRTTVLRDDDGSVHHIPNGIITVTTNRTLDYSQINERLVITSESEIPDVEKLINKIGTEIAAMEVYEKIIKEPLHFEKVNGFNGNGDLIVSVSGRTVANGQYKVLGEFYNRLRVAARKQKIAFKADK